jgi:hypothetical protein
MTHARRFAIIASASGNGKTTLARLLSRRLGIPCLELDSLVHGPNWQEVPDSHVQAQVQCLLKKQSWVIDGNYFKKLGMSVLDASDLVIWLDLPLPLVLMRLICRSMKRWSSATPLWNGNRESLASVIGGKDSLIGFAIITQARRRRTWPAMLHAYPVIRLRSSHLVSAFLSGITQGMSANQPRPRKPSIALRGH